MNNRITLSPLVKPFLPDLLERGKLWLVFLVVFMGVVMDGMGQNTTTPSYEWLTDVILPTVNVSLSGVNTEDIAISVATDPEGNVYTLTFGKGVSKRSSTGALIDDNFISANNLNSPSDIAIDEDGFLYISNFLAQANCSNKGKIKVFDSAGTLLGSKTISTSFYRPLGLDVDDEFVYVAEYNQSGSECESEELSKISKYNKSSGASVQETDEVNTPFRIAVDSQKNIFVSQAGSSSSSVRMYDQDLIYQNSLPGILSPGSIVIDSFDFIHVIEYDGRIDFSRFINFESLSITEVQAIAKSIDEGQRADAFSIKIFNSGRTSNIIYKDQIDFPVDLAFNRCDRMYVNNAQVFGYDSSIGYIPEKIEFDIEIYQRTPSFDVEKPVLNCPDEQKEIYDPSTGFTLPDYRDFASVSDNCSVQNVTQNPPQGTIIVDDTQITLVVTDTSGNSTQCQFLVILVEDEVLEISCPLDQKEEMDKDCQVEVPDYIKLADVNLDGAVITQSPAPGELINENTTVTLTATSGNNIDSCTFQLILEDTIDPEINCPDEQMEVYDLSAGFTLPDYRDLASVSDNCSVQNITQNPPQGTVINQDTQITLGVTDTSGNYTQCQFLVILVEEEVLEISCPGNQGEEVDQDCQVEVSNYRDLADVNFKGAVITQSPPPGEIINQNTIVILTATLDGKTDECSFEIIINDAMAPVANCVTKFEIKLNANGTANISADDINDGSSDNCRIVNMEIDKTNFTTADLGENTVELSITDTAGNIDTCEATVIVTASDPPPPDDFVCKEKYTLELDANGEATLSAEDLYTGDPGDRKFSLSKLTFTCEDIGNNPVTLSFSGDDGNRDCDIAVEIKDSFSPEVRAQDISINLDGQGQAILSPNMLDNGTTDNCGEVELSLDKTVFSCNDLGENEVILSAKDGNGNATTVTAIVTVAGECDGEPPVKEDVDYIYIYPNPTPGPFRFAVPRNVEIEKVEVYDFRGRFILVEEFVDTSTYSMDLTGLQRAIYVLKVFTTGRIETVRVIVY